MFLLPYLGFLLSIHCPVPHLGSCCDVIDDVLYTPDATLSIICFHVDPEMSTPVLIINSNDIISNQYEHYFVVYWLIALVYREMINDVTL